MIYFINGLQWSGYQRFDWSVVGESACADSWGRALKTRQPSLSIPCFAERRYGGVLDDEMLMALPPDDIAKAIAGMEALARNGLRYPFPQYGIQQDVRAGMAVSYPGREGGAYRSALRRVAAPRVRGDWRRLLPWSAHASRWLLHQGRQGRLFDTIPMRRLSGSPPRAPDPNAPSSQIHPHACLEPYSVRGHRLAHCDLFRISAFDHHSLMSRCVIVPINWSFSPTGSAAASRSAISRAASLNVSSGLSAYASGLTMSPTLIERLLSPPPEVNRHWQTPS
jgi:hypothetical protein